jgi:hypothetical protein
MPCRIETFAPIREEEEIMRFQRVSSKCATTEGRGGNLGNRSGWPRPPVALIGVALLIPGLITTAHAATCESLAGLKLATTTISAAQLVPAGAFKPPAGSATGPVQTLFKGMPAFCRVQGVLKPSTDSYIEFEVWLPVSAWNGKYQGTGNGGFTNPNILISAVARMADARRCSRLNAIRPIMTALLPARQPISGPITLADSCGTPRR